jgi:hypothetical protein
VTSVTQTAPSIAPGASTIAVSRGTVAGQLGALVALSTAVWAVLGATMAAPWVVPDEIIYSDLAKSIAAGHLPAIRGVTTFGYGVGYPLLIAPAWALAASTHVAYAVALAFNALLMSSAAVPSYLLARRFLSHGTALLVASLSVLLPAMAFTSMILTENAYYPAFLLALLAIVRAVEKPTSKRQALALGATAVTFAIKLLGVVLLPIYVVAIVVLAFLGRGPVPMRRALAVYKLTFLVVAVSAAAVTAASELRGAGAAGALGAYAGVVQRIDFVGLPWAFLLHVAALDLTSGLIPFAATAFLVWEVWRRRLVDESVRRFAAVACGCMVSLPATIAVSAGAIKAGSAGLGANAHFHERYLFMSTPLFLTGLGICLERGLTRRSQAALVVGAVAAVLVAVIPVGHLRDNAGLQAPSLIIWLLFRHGQLALALAGLLICLAFVLVGRRRGLLWGLVAFLFATGAILTYANSYARGRSSRDTAVGADRGWIDGHVTPRANVAVLWNEPGRPGETAPPRPAQSVIWENEFFNRSVTAVYAIGAAGPEPVPQEIPAKVRGNLVVGADGRPLRSTYVLTCGIRIDAPIVARDPGTSAILYKVDGVVRVRSVGPSMCQGKSSGKNQS